MSTIYLVHGFNVKDGGDATIGTLRQALEHAGNTVIMVKYGWMHRMRVRMCTKGVARMFASMAKPNSVVVAHSNGANVVHAAAGFGVHFKHVFLINPALDADMDIPNADRVTVFHAPSDPWTRAARWIPFSKWGRQGQIGYTGTDTRYTSVDLDALSGEKLGHSGVFASTYARALVLITIKGLME